MQRPAKLVKHLREHGWSLDVLTAAHNRFPWHDDTLLSELPADTAIHRVRGFEPACLAPWASWTLKSLSSESQKWVEDRVYWRLASLAARLGQGNGEAAWALSASRAATKLHRNQPYDAVISTGPPHFVHKIAQKLSLRTGIPWLCDLRDPLVSDFDRTAHSNRMQRRARSLELAIAEDARAVITTTSAFAHDLQKHYPHRSHTIRCITNGFDRSDLLPHEAISARPGQDEECLLLASGSFYGRRDLRRIMDALEAVFNVHPEWIGRVRLMVAGTIDAEQRRRLEKNTPSWLTLHGYVDHSRSIELAMRVACSIVIVPECRHGRLSIPAKTFELIALPRHVLGLVPVGSETEMILQRAGACTLCPFENDRGITNALEHIIASHFAGTLDQDRIWSRLNCYDRRTISHEFAECLDRVCGITRQLSPSKHQEQQEVEFVLSRLPLTPAEPGTRCEHTGDEITVEIQ